MNSKMMALAAVLVVGVLAAAGVGYAYTATYTSQDNAVTPQFAVVTTLTEGQIGYDTNYNAKTVTYVSTVNSDDNTFIVNIDASKMPSVGTLALTSYKVYFQDGQYSTGGTNLTDNGVAASSKVVTSVNDIALTIPDSQAYAVNASNPITVTVAGSITSVDDNTITAAVCYIDHVELMFTATPTSNP